MIDFAAVFDQLPEAHVLLDRDLRCVGCNRAYERATHLRREDVIGKTILDAFPHDPSDPDNASARRLRTSLEKVFATREPDVLAYVPYRIPSMDGHGLELRFWSATHVPVFDERGEVVLVIQHTTDITDLDSIEGPGHTRASVLGRARRIERVASRIDEELQRLRTYVEQAPGFVAVLRGPEHVFEIANRSLLEGIGHRKVLKQPFAQAIPELVEQGIIGILDRVYRTGESHTAKELRVVVADEHGTSIERLLDVVAQPIIEDAEIIGIYIQGYEVTEQLRLAEERRILLELLPAIVWSAKADGSIDFLNDRAVEYHGVPREKICGHAWIDFVLPMDREPTLARYLRSLATGEPYEHHFRLRRGDGQYRWFMSRALPVRDGAGEIIRWIGTNIDVDEARRARDDLERRVKYEKQLIGIVSHDLRNPLNAISLATQLLLQDHLDARNRAAAMKIASAADRAGRMVRDFMDLAEARSEHGIPIQPAPTDLRVVLRHVLDELRLAYAGREITVTLSNSNPTCACDADRISQVFSNLIANAFQHGDPKAPISVALTGTAHHVAVAIHNRGTEIPSETIDQLFEPFARGRGATSAGMGLGLYISREIVAAHGGSIDVRSSATDGTTFTVRLPRGHAVRRDDARVHLSRGHHG